jgi:hypothetical protein
LLGILLGVELLFNGAALIALGLFRRSYLKGQRVGRQADEEPA